VLCVLIEIVNLTGEARNPRSEVTGVSMVVHSETSAVNPFSTSVMVCGPRLVTLPSCELVGPKFEVRGDSRCFHCLCSE
jgi:hypothetical protein